MLRSAAAERELASAKSVANVLAFRVDQHQVPTQAAPPRTPTAADLVASSYPTPLAAARPGSSGRPQDLAVLGAALELGREADTERQTARAAAGTPDDTSTPHVDERREGQNEAQAHTGHAGADQGRATGLLGQAEASRADHRRAPATATAALSYPTPIKEVTAAQATPKATPATPAARAATRKAPTSGRRRCRPAAHDSNRARGTRARRSLLYGADRNNEPPQPPDPSSAWDVGSGTPSVNVKLPLVDLGPGPEWCLLQFARDLARAYDTLPRAGQTCRRQAHQALVPAAASGFGGGDREPHPAGQGPMLGSKAALRT